MVRERGERIAKIWINEEKGVLTVRTPYSSGFVNKLKSSIPRESRRWNPIAMVWEVEVEHTDEVVKILHQCFAKVVTLFDDQKVSSDEFFSLLDKADITAIYKLLAKKYHPDVGGSPEVMKKLNIFFGKIK